MTIKFKSATEQNEWDLIRKRLQTVLIDIAGYFNANGYDCVLTDLLSEKDENLKLRRVSKSHDEGRAGDIRTRDIPKEFINEVIKHFNNKYEDWAAISANGGLPCLIVYHNNGNGPHFHVQIKPYKD